MSSSKWLDTNTKRIDVPLPAAYQTSFNNGLVQAVDVVAFKRKGRVFLQVQIRLENQTNLFNFTIPDGSTGSLLVQPYKHNSNILTFIRKDT